MFHAFVVVGPGVSSTAGEGFPLHLVGCLPERPQLVIAEDAASRMTCTLARPEDGR